MTKYKAFLKFGSLEFFSGKYKPLFGFTVTFCFSFLLFLLYIPYPSFLDELDNLWGGMQIHAGRIPYLDFYSQHTPLAYYVSAFGYFLGADTLVAQRVFFYLLMSLGLALLFLRNFKYFGFLPLLFTAVFYVTSHAANPDLSYTFLSDQIQALAYLFIFYELLSVILDKRQTTSTWLVLSISSFAAVSVAFISVYFVFFALVSTWLYILIQTIKQNNKDKIASSQLSKKLALPPFVVITPFLLYFCYLLITNSVRQFYEQAYLLNVETYSKYIGGFGQNALEPVVGPFLGFSSHFNGTISSILDSIVDLSLQNFYWSNRDFLNFFVILLLSIVIFRTNKLSAFLFLFVMAYSQMRGWGGFHSQPYWAISAASASLLLWSKQYGIFSLGIKGATKVIISSLVSLFMVFGWLYKTTDPLPPGSLSIGNVNQTTKEIIVTTLVEPTEGYIDTSLDIGTFISTKRLPSGGIGGIVPWFTDVYEAEFVSKISSDKPKIIFYNPKDNIWGYELGVFAPLLRSYIENNYTKINVVESDFDSGIWIRNDYVHTAEEKLFEIFPNFRYEKAKSFESLETFYGEPILSNKSLAFSFMNSVSSLKALQMRFGTYSRENICDVTIHISSGSTTLNQREIKCEKIEDNKLILFTFDNANVNIGSTVNIRISSNSNDPDNSVTVLLSDYQPPKGDFTVGGVTQKGSIVLNLLTERKFK